MGTETYFIVEQEYNATDLIVKLNNPLMGTETYHKLNSYSLVRR